MKIAMASFLSKIRTLRPRVALAAGSIALAVLTFHFSSSSWRNHSYNAIACLIAVLFIGLRRLVAPRVRIERLVYLVPLVLLLVFVLNHNYKYDVKQLYKKSSIRTWNVYHYYLGSKYFDELGYLDLYKQTIAADREGKNRLAKIKRIRDLETYQTIQVSSLKDLGRSKTFTDARWEAFKKDLNVLLRKESDSTWFDMLNDRGYNPPPFWNTLGRWISHALNISKKRNLLVLTSLDIVAFALMFGAMIWAFGVEAALLAFLAFAILPFSKGRLIGGYLQYDWMAAITLGVCALHKGKNIWAGLFFGYAAMARAFPLILFAGLAFPALRHLLQTHRLERQHLVLAVSFGLFCLLGLGIGSLSTEGPSAWMHWKSKIDLHNHEMTYGERRIGLKHLFTHELGSDTYEGDGARRKNLDKQKGLYIASAGLLLLLLLPSWWLTRRETNAILLMHVVFFALLISSRYYWSILALFPLWQTAAPPKESPPDMTSPPSGDSGTVYAPIGWPALLPFLVSAAWFHYALGESNRYAHYLHFNTLLVVALIGLMGWILLRKQLCRQQAQDGKKRTNGVRSGPR